MAKKITPYKMECSACGNKYVLLAKKGRVFIFYDDCPKCGKFAARPEEEKDGS